jgi:hypothetical protein
MMSGCICQRNAPAEIVLAALTAEDRAASRRIDAALPFGSLLSSGLMAGRFRRLARRGRVTQGRID